VVESLSIFIIPTPSIFTKPTLDLVRGDATIIIGGRHQASMYYLQIRWLGAGGVDVRL
jgi:hypothetical protein